MQTVDTIIQARWLIPIEGEKKYYENYAVAIDQGNITALGPQQDIAAKYQTDNLITLDRHALLPGFINMHTHIAMNLLRGLADDLPLMTWLQDHIWPAEQKHAREDFVRDGSSLAVAEMIKSGITCFNDMYFYPGATAEVVKQAGIRASIGINIMSLETPWAKTAEECIEKGMAVQQQYQNNPLINFSLAPHAIYTVADEHFKKVVELAEKHNLPIHCHIQESKTEVDDAIAKHNKRPLRHLADLGLVSSRLLAVHMTQVDQEDMTLMQEGRAHVVHCPESNAKLASGYCPVTDFLDNGVNVALGTDGAASNNDLDMIGEMRTAAFLAKLMTKNPEALDAHTALKMATINGAKALGQDKLIGSIVPGKQADLIAIDLQQLETQPLYDPISQIVYASCRQQVTDTWVAGRQLLQQRQLTTLNESNILNAATQWQRKLS